MAASWVWEQAKERGLRTQSVWGRARSACCLSRSLAKLMFLISLVDTPLGLRRLGCRSYWPTRSYWIICRHILALSTCPPRKILKATARGCAWLGKR